MRKWNNPELVEINVTETACVPGVDNAFELPSGGVANNGGWDNESGSNGKGNGHSNGNGKGHYIGKGNGHLKH